MGEDDLKETTVMKGIGVSPGVVIGKAYLFDRRDAQVPLYKLNDPSLIAGEIRRFRKALRESEKQLIELKNQLSDLGGGMQPLYIIDIHIMILRDRKFIDLTIRNIREMSVNAEWAVRMTIDKYREIFDRMEDDYLRGRISDIQYAGQRIITNLGEKNLTVVEMGEGFIIIATDLSPADTAQMKIDRVLGFATDMGGKTSHTAIVARSLEIPAVLGLENITRSVQTNDDIIIDGSAGVVIVRPDPEVSKRYEEKKRLYEEAQDDLLDYAKLPAVTKDSYSVEIGGNIEFIEEIPSAIAHGADGIGLYRTEFIYINRKQLPDEEDHLANYRSVVGVEGLSWSTIRTFDLGGDKFFPNAQTSRELNPQMGLRGIRFCLKEVELFKVQLRAILRASDRGKLRIMFPMISGIEEILEAKRIFYEVKNELLKRGVAVGNDIEIGVMIEVPSAVIVAEELAKEVDFFSIGTNDLIQYVLAIDRINERVTYLYEPLHPAVLSLIKQVVDIGHKAGIRVAMCGEMAGDPTYTMILLGLELDELSMNPLAIPRVKKIVRGSTLKESKTLLNKVMTLSSSSEIRALVEATMQKRFPEEFQVNGQ
ncbi:MAG: phosphoenolpyruvate--protein phosphotransferase [Pseudomonadota bacterium]|nr:phosphoenolpyruvate--protein phosphotransferase [Pseudomonadota bacterium]MBU4121438.1 phosphoenolpyruvate--protein phosphotransferase [Pseudomonadota bacterium]